MSSHLLMRADARRIPLADGSVHCVVTSPPYYALRDYGTARWEGGDPGCDHVQRMGGHLAESAASVRGGARKMSDAQSLPYRDRCRKCGARRVDDQIGLERTPDEFVAAMVAVFREVRRILRDDGTLWLNLGDGFSAGGRGGNGTGSGAFHGNGYREEMAGVARRPPPGLGPKQLLGMPWRVALAIQADGWYLRSEIIWAKPNPMPESVTDRPSKSHEQVFLLSKRERYFYDADAVREPMIAGANGSTFTQGKTFLAANARAHVGMGERRDNPAGRNLRSVWTIATEAYPGAHFATFPRALVKPCILAGTSARGVCPRCGSPWVRVVERYRTLDGKRREDLPPMRSPDGTNGAQGFGHWRTATVSNHLGWRPSCPHGDLPPVPAVVLDPFCGSGTTIVVANALGRRGIGLDLSAEYLGMARRRIERPHAPVPRPGRAEELPLFEGRPT